VRVVPYSDPFLLGAHVRDRARTPDVVFVSFTARRVDRVVQCGSQRLTPQKVLENGSHSDDISKTFKERTW
jgi:hypothetical protein